MPFLKNRLEATLAEKERFCAIMPQNERILFSSKTHEQEIIEIFETHHLQKADSNSNSRNWLRHQSER